MICPNCQKFNSYTEQKCQFCGFPIHTLGPLFQSGRELTVSLSAVEQDCYRKPGSDIRVRVDALAKAFKAKELEVYNGG